MCKPVIQLVPRDVSSVLAEPLLYALNVILTISCKSDPPPVPEGVPLDSLKIPHRMHVSQLNSVTLHVRLDSVRTRVTLIHVRLANL